MSKTKLNYVSVPFMLMAIVFNVCLIASNLFAAKVITLGPIHATAGLLVFPISYIINDCMTEVWGFRKARLIIWSGFAMNFFLVALGMIASHLPSPSSWTGGEHFNYIFNFAPRLAIASLMAFLVGSFFNSYVMSRMKVMHHGKHFSLRAIVSTLVGESFDSLIFFPLAYFGIMSWELILHLMLVEVALKSLYEVIVLPITVQVVKWVKKIEGSDVYDEKISYNVLHVSDM